MRKVYFIKVEVGGSIFYRGVWETIELARQWAREHWNDNPTAVYTVEIMHVMASMLA